ncbi:MAG: hypothetical protein COB37_10925 [Kordiimonadales bacterium]|nr:MAG: hypothetical protein COB37_10925 [Kordiimonadales bacterium]
MHWPEEFFQFLDWWKGLSQRGNIVPSAAEFERSFPDNLKSGAVLLKRRKGGGLHICALGDDIKKMSPLLLVGVDYMSLFPIEQAVAIGEHLVSICGHPCGGDSLRTVQQANGDAYVLHHLFLPMADDQGIISNVVGYVKTESVTETKIKESRSSQFDLVSFVDIGSGIP